VEDATNAVAGNVAALLLNFVDVRLDDGRDIRAILPKRLAREMFRIVPGDPVRIGLMPKPRITGFDR